MGSAEQVVFSAKRHGAYCIFDQVIINLYAAVFKIWRQLRQFLHGIVKCLADGLFAQVVFVLDN